MIGIIRNRVVLAAIFVCSLIYFVLQTQLHKRFSGLSGAFGGANDPSSLGEGAAAAVDDAAWKSDIVLAEEMRSRLFHRHIQWMKQAEQQSTVETATNGRKARPAWPVASQPAVDRACKHTRQGRLFVTDSRGYTCTRLQLLGNGCCDENGTDVQRFSCVDCNSASACCPHYEICVSCCLNQASSNFISVISALSSQQLYTFMHAADNYDMCSIKCRTSSGSVNHEFKYKNSELKYCYRTEP